MGNNETSGNTIILEQTTKDGHYHLDMRSHDLNTAELIKVANKQFKKMIPCKKTKDQ